MCNGRMCNCASVLFIFVFWSVNAKWHWMHLFGLPSFSILPFSINFIPFHSSIHSIPFDYSIDIWWQHFCANPLNTPFILSRCSIHATTMQQRCMQQRPNQTDAMQFYRMIFSRKSTIQFSQNSTTLRSIALKSFICH